MNGRYYVRVALFAALTVLAACAEKNNKIGTTIKGERVAVMSDTKTLTADKAVANTAPVLPPMSVNMSWPQAGYNSVHAMPYVETVAAPHVAWRADIGEGSDSDFKILARPIVDKGTIYAMDSHGTVSAFDLKSGERLWRVETTPADSDYEAIGGGIAADGGVIFATTGFGDVYALDGKTGAQKWRKSLQKPLRAAPAISDNRVYVVSIDNELYALAAADGEQIWRHAGIAETATLMGASSPAAELDNVVVAYNSGEIFDLRAQNGRVSWNFSLANATQVGALPAIADIRGLPVIDRGRVYAISHSGRMAAIDQRSGERVWEVDLGGIDTPVVAGDSVFVYGGDQQLLALSRDSGRILWTVQMDKRVDREDADSDRLTWTGPVLAGERLWMVNSAGWLAAFSPADGSPMGKVEIGEPMFIAPIVVNRALYIVTDEGSLVALR